MTLPTTSELGGAARLVFGLLERARHFAADLYERFGHGGQGRRQTRGNPFVRRVPAFGPDVDRGLGRPEPIVGVLNRLGHRFLLGTGAFDFGQRAGRRAKRLLRRLIGRAGAASEDHHEERR